MKISLNFEEKIVTFFHNFFIFLCNYPFFLYKSKHISFISNAENSIQKRINLWSTFPTLFKLCQKINNFLTICTNRTNNLFDNSIVNKDE